MVVHLAGGLVVRKPDTYVGSNLGTVRDTLEALEGSSVRRLVFLSFIRAEAGSRNAYLNAKGLAEEAVGGCLVPTVTFRCAHIVGPFRTIQDRQLRPSCRGVARRSGSSGRDVSASTPST